MFHDSLSISPRPLALDAVTPDILTLEERAELERAIDGPITSAMIADKLRAREKPTTAYATSPQYLRALLIWARADLKFYEVRIADLEAEITALMADRDRLYAPAEKDRQTRHIAALNRQRDALMEDCRPYRAAIHNTIQKLAAHQNIVSE